MIQGIALSSVIALVSYLISLVIPISAVVIAIIIGIIISNTINIKSEFSKGITYSEKTILAWAIAFMGINLNFTILSLLGYKTIFLVVASMVLTIFATLLLAKLFNIDRKFAMLLGIGNAVCGASAIAATKGVIKAKDDEVGISIAIVNLLGTIGMFLIPIVTYFIGFDEITVGILIGNTLQAVGQVVASGFLVGDIAGQNATIIKMLRVLMLTFILVILIFSCKDSDVRQNTNAGSVLKNIPLFIVGFILFSIIATLEVLPANIIDIIDTLSKLLLIIAMSAIGLKISFSSIKKNGKNALILASIVFALQIIFTSIYLILV